MPLPLLAVDGITIPVTIPPASNIRSRTIPSDKSKLNRVKGGLNRVSELVRSEELRSLATPPLPRNPSATPPASKPISVASLAAAPLKMRKLWNPALPSLKCSNCAFSTQCSQYRMGYECAFLPFLTSHKIESVADLKFYMKELLTEGIRRAQTGMLMETLTGAAPSLELTEALNGLYHQFSNALQLEMKTAGGSDELEASHNVIGDLFGSMETLVSSTRAAKAQIDHDNEAVVRIQRDAEENAHKAQSTRLSKKQTSEVDSVLARDYQQQTKE